jgi:hypothetical protein
MFGSVRVDSGETVIQEQVATTAVDGTGKRDSLLLATRQTDTLFSDKSLVTSIKDLKVTLESTGFENGTVATLIVGRGEDDVFLYGIVDQPRFLGTVSDTVY